MQKVLILTRGEIASLMHFSDYVEAVEQAFRLLGSKQIFGPDVMDIPGKDGMFHIKGAGMVTGENIYVAVKVNGNFPENQKRFRLPTIQGAILLCDGIRGNPLALLDSVEITIQRTAAATAVAAKHLARSNATTATICGCGIQGKAQLRALTSVLTLKSVFAFDRDEKLAQQYSREMSEDLGIQVVPTQSLQEATVQSEVIVTCTTSRKFFLNKEHVRKGTFISAVGADSHDKQEIHPALLASSKVVTDIRNQCVRIGDLHHAIQAEMMTAEEVYADLHEIVSAVKAPPDLENEIVIFDSTGTAVQDVASSAIVYERARERGIGTFI